MVQQRAPSSAIRFITPSQRHANLDGVILEQRKLVYEAARALRPQRWRGSIRNWQRIQAVHLNPDQTKTRANANEKEEKANTQKAA